MLRIGTADSDFSKQVGLVGACEDVVAAMEHFAYLDAAIEQVFAGGFDVGDDQVQALGGARRRRGDVLAEDDRAPRAFRRKLDTAPVVTVGEVAVEPPSEPRVELLRAIDIRDREDDNLELHVNPRNTRDLCRVDTMYWFRAHNCFLRRVE